ncbi:MAG: helix-turn-helix domain-containing protein [Aureliella sp.]
MLELTITVAEFCRRMSIGRTKAYELIARKEIEVLKIDRRTLITMRSVAALIDRSLS